ncbi:MAG: hypothetical protein V1887_04660 [Candidatus Aenigmatarchaeota archaeon]
MGIPGCSDGRPDPQLEQAIADMKNAKDAIEPIYAAFLAKYDTVLGTLALPGRIMALHYGKVSKKPITNEIEFKGYRLDFQKFEQITEKEIRENNIVAERKLLLCISEPMGEVAKGGDLVREDKIREIQKNRAEAITNIKSHKFAYSKCKWNGRWEECEYKVSDIEASTYEELKKNDKEQKRIVENLGAGERAYASEKEEADAEVEQGKH